MVAVSKLAGGRRHRRRQKALHANQGHGHLNPSYPERESFPPPPQVPPEQMMTEEEAYMQQRHMNTPYHQRAANNNANHHRLSMTGVF